MQLYINPSKSPAVVQLKANAQPIASLRFKRGAIVPMEVVVVGAGDASHMRFGVKERNAYGGELLLLAGPVDGTPGEDGMHFNFALDVSSAPLHEALGIGSGEPLPVLPAMAEFEWLEGGAVRLSDTISTQILNDIIASAAETPAAVISEYPAADRVATKDWVNALNASADKPGLAKLGTGAVIPNAEAVPVGVDKTGGLAVSTSTLSAYAAACRHGVSGTEAEWVASLRGERGEKGEKGDTGEFSAAALEEVLHQDYEQVVPASGTDNANTYGLAIVTKRAGKVKSLTVTTRLSSASCVNGTALYCKLWLVVDGDAAHPQFLALSDNAETQVLGEECTWNFPWISATELPAGSHLRATFHTEANSVNTTYGQGLSQIGVRCAPNTEADVGCLGSGTGINMASVVPVHTLLLRADNFAPAHHVDDVTAHVTEEERTRWNAAAGDTSAVDALRGCVQIKHAGGDAGRAELEDMFPDATVYIEQDLVAGVEPSMAPASIVVSFAEGAEKRYALPASTASQVTLADNAAVAAHVLNPDIHLTGAVQETIMGLDGRFNNTEQRLVEQVYNLGKLTGDTEVVASVIEDSNLMFVGLPGRTGEYYFSMSDKAPEVEIWFELGDTAFNVTWPAAWIWVEGTAPALQAGTAYRVCLRYERLTHRFVARKLYSYAVPASA